MINKFNIIVILQCVQIDNLLSRKNLVGTVTPPLSYVKCKFLRSPNKCNYVL